MLAAFIAPVPAVVRRPAVPAAATCAAPRRPAPVRACAAPPAAAASAAAVAGAAFAPRPQPRGSRLLSDLAVGDELTATVATADGAASLWLDARVVAPARRGGWRRVRGRLRYEVVCERRRGAPRGAPGELTWTPVKPPEKVGDAVAVRVKAVNVAAQRFEVERVAAGGGRGRRGPGKAPGRRALPREEVAAGEGGRVVLLDDLSVGQQLSGVVVRVAAAGAVLDCGTARRGRGGALVRAHGLLQRKRFPADWASAADAVVRDDAARRVSVGDALAVWVRAAHPANGFLWLAAAPVDEAALAAERAAWVTKMRRRRRRRQGPEVLEVGEVRRGAVRERVKFGAFVDIGLTTDGLVHFTGMGEAYRAGWEATVTVGRPVVVKVRDVSAGGRVSLDLLAVGEEDIAALDAARAAAAAAAAGAAVGKGPMARPAAVAAGAEATVVEGEGEDGGDGEDCGGGDGENGDGENGDGNDDFISDAYLEDKYGDY